MSEDTDIPEQNEAQRLDRPTVPELDEVLGVKFDVLDDGFVRVVDYMGSDQSIVQAARVSYGVGTRQVHQDRGLIRYLMRHHHTTPFEMCDIKFHLRVPMDSWRQWIRHRTASVNEYSTRYSLAIDAAQTTPPDAWRFQAAENRQGSSGFVDIEQGAHFTKRNGNSRKPPAPATKSASRPALPGTGPQDLPLSTYTEAYWKVNLLNLLRFLLLRMDDHAQWEIRQYAELIGHRIVSVWCPMTWQAFLDYSVNAMQLSHVDWAIIQAIQAEDDAKLEALLVRYRFVSKSGVLRRSRERQELEAKLRKLNMRIPWQSRKAPLSVFPDTRLYDFPYPAELDTPCGRTKPQRGPMSRGNPAPVFRKYVVPDPRVREAIRDALVDFGPSQRRTEAWCDWVMVFEDEGEKLVLKQYQKGSLTIQGKADPCSG